MNNIAECYTVSFSKVKALKESDQVKIRYLDRRGKGRERGGAMVGEGAGQGSSSREAQLPSRTTFSWKRNLRRLLFIGKGMIQLCSYLSWKRADRTFWKHSILAPRRGEWALRRYWGGSFFFFATPFAICNSSSWISRSKILYKLYYNSFLV